MYIHLTADVSRRQEFFLVFGFNKFFSLRLVPLRDPLTEHLQWF